MKRRTNLALSLLATVCGLVFLSSPAAAATVTLSPGANLTRAVETAAIGDTIKLNPGTYTPQNTAGWQFPKFAIVKKVRIVGLGTDPSQVVLSAPSTTDYAVRFASYNFVGGGNVPGDPSGATLENLTIQSGISGVGIVESYRLHDITLKNVVINATSAADAIGVVVQSADRIALEGLTVTSTSNAFRIYDANDTLLINSSVVSVSQSGSNALAVLGGSRNIVVNNTFGTAPPTATSTPIINGGSVGFTNSQANRFELNTVQGHRDDGIDLHNTIANTAPSQQTLDNYVGKNIVISNGYTAGRTAGTSIWVNCSSNNSWIYGNDVQGGPEAGVTNFLSASSVFAGNRSHNNKDAGFFVSGSASDAYSFCDNTAYRVKPNHNYLFSNAAFHNKVDSVVIRTSDNTDVVMNYISPNDGFGGLGYACTAPTAAECQSGIALEASVSAARALRNTLDGANRGLWVNDGTITGLEFFGNRVLGSTLNRLIAPSGPQNLDYGSTLGGNFWSQFSVFGNPSATAFTAISYDSTNASNGPVSDRYPFQSEDFALTLMSVSEPVLNGQYAQGSARTVRWYAPACTYVDLTLDGVTTLKALDGVADLATNLANTGYAVVRIPTNAAPGTHDIVATCKNSAGAATGLSATGPTFSVTNGNLTLLSPGRDDVFNAGQDIWVSWKRATGFSDPVTVELSTDGGASYTQLGSSTTLDFMRVTLPSVASTAYAMLRIVSGSATDTTDGFFAIRGSSGAGFTNVPNGRSFKMGQMERLEWASPQNSRLVTLSYTSGGSPVTIVTDLPDRGYLDWIVPAVPTTNLILTVSFKTSAGTAISSSTLSSGTASTSYPPQALGVTKTGSGTVTGTGISCGSTCSAIYTFNTVVTLTATASAGSSFSSWSGACSGTSPTCNVTMDSAKGVTAIFDTGTLIVRYRLYSPVTLEHLYTTSLSEYNYLPTTGAWNAEGAIYRLFQGPGRFAGVDAVPYYRLYNSGSRQHHWTTDFSEYNFLATVGWNQEGIDGYILPTEAPGSIPLYRLIFPAQGLHLWTTDVGEKTRLTTTAGWVEETLSGYVVPLPPS